MRKMTRLFVASLCMAALTSCGEQRKQVTYEEQGPFEVFQTPNKEVTPYRIPAITKTSKGELLAVAETMVRLGAMCLPSSKAMVSWLIRTRTSHSPQVMATHA